MNDPKDFAPGAPGMEPHRTKTILSGLGTAFQASSRVTFSLSRGIVAQVCFPDGFSTCAHDLEWIVTDGGEFFSEEKRHADHQTAPLEEGVPAYRSTNTCRQGKYRIAKEVITDPLRDVILQKNTFSNLEGDSLRLYLLLSPHNDHTAWVGQYKGVPMLFAQKNGVTLALVTSHPWKQSSVGFNGVSDGWMDLAAHRQMTRTYTRAESGRVSLIAEIDLSQMRRPAPGSAVPGNAVAGSEILVSLAFGANEQEAAGRAWDSLMEGFDPARDRYMAQWRQWQHSLSVVATGNSMGKYVKNSALILRYRESKIFPGAIQTDGLVSPRELAGAFGAYMGLAAREDAGRLLGFLLATQEPRGYWPQTLHPNGSPASSVVALDQVAQVILLVDACRRAFMLSPAKMHQYWSLVQKASAYLVSNGPQTAADRWNGPGGLCIYTLSVQIAALLAAADMADERQQPGIGTYCRKTADYLQERIDEWTYVSGTPQAIAAGVPGYYAYGANARLPAAPLGAVAATLEAPAKRPHGQVSADALALVRFGLRKADDPRMLDTLKVIDAHLRVDTPNGPGWKRFEGDQDTWPILLAERAQYEVAAGNIEAATTLLRSMESLAHHGFFPGDAPADVHAAYIQLCCSLKSKSVIDLPRFTVERYQGKNPEVPFVIWRSSHPLLRLPRGKKLRIELPESALIHWSDDDWVTKQHTLTRDTQLGINVAEISPREHAGRKLVFTFFWLASDHWENKNYSVAIN